jgi:alanine-synthesizing transaminase
MGDTYLSVSSPVQWALSAWLRGRDLLQNQIKERVRSNLATLDDLLARQRLLTRLEVDAGWYAVLRIPSVQTGEDLACALLERGVVVHTGEFFGFAGRDWLVISLIVQREEFRVGVEALSNFWSIQGA